MKKWLLILSPLVFSGCVQLGTGLANIPADFSKNKVITNIVYGDKPWQKLDIYTPEHHKGQKLPVVVFFYGGRWTDGNKSMYKFVGDKFADNQFIAVIADYSKYPHVKFPTFIQDAAKAIAWTDDHIEQYDGNRNELFVAGHSSGAHIGALVCADKRYLAAEGKSTQIIKGFAGLAGPYDFVPDEPDLKAMFGPPANYPQMQVPTFIDGTEPPMLLLWGASDKIVGKQNMDLLATKIREKGGVVETEVFPDMGHIGIMANLTWLSSNQPSVMQTMVTFFKSLETQNKLAHKTS